MTSSAAAAAARATAAWRLFQGEVKEGPPRPRPNGAAPRATVQAPSSPELACRLTAMKARTALAAFEEKARLPAPVPAQRPAPALLSARGESRVSAPGSPDPLKTGVQAPYATESPNTVKGVARRRTYHENYESRQAVHNGAVPMTGSESLASLATQAPAGVINVQPGMKQFSGRKSLVESEHPAGSARQEKTLVARRQQQPRQATNVQRRRSQPQEGYQEEEKAKQPVAVGDKNIAKVEDYGKANLFRARSILPTLNERPPERNERPPLSDLQAGYAAPVLLGHPMNREPARSWEPKCDLDSKTQVPESIFKAMEKLGHAARHRGQHILAKSSRNRGRKTLIRHDCLPGRVTTTDYTSSSGGFEAKSELRPRQKVTTGELRPNSNWRSVLGIPTIGSKEALLRSF